MGLYLSLLVRGSSPLEDALTVLERVWGSLRVVSSVNVVGSSGGLGSSVFSGLRVLFPDAFCLLITVCTRPTCGLITYEQKEQKYLISKNPKKRDVGNSAWFVKSHYLFFFWTDHKSNTEKKVIIFVCIFYIIWSFELFLP